MSVSGGKKGVTIGPSEENWDKAEAWFAQNKNAKKFNTKREEGFVHSFIKIPNFKGQGVDKIIALKHSPSKERKSEVRLGEGAFGIVKRGYLRPNKKDKKEVEVVAIKIEPVLRDKPESAELKTLNELGRYYGQMKRNLEKPSIEKGFATKKIYTVMELAKGEELTKQLYELDEDGDIKYDLSDVFHPKRIPKKQFDDTQKLIIAIKLAEQIELLHKLNIIHSDIKLENFHIEIGPNNDQDISTTILDFGNSLHLGNMNFVKASLRGTPGYAAPELFDGAIISFNAEVVRFKEYKIAKEILKMLMYRYDTLNKQKKEQVKDLEKRMEGYKKLFTKGADIYSLSKLFEHLYPDRNKKDSSKTDEKDQVKRPKILIESLLSRMGAAKPEERPTIQEVIRSLYKKLAAQPPKVLNDSTKAMIQKYKDKVNEKLREPFEKDILTEYKKGVSRYFKRSSLIKKREIQIKNLQSQMTQLLEMNKLPIEEKLKVAKGLLLNMNDKLSGRRNRRSKLRRIINKLSKQVDVISESFGVKYNDSQCQEAFEAHKVLTLGPLHQRANELPPKPKKESKPLVKKAKKLPPHPKKELPKIPKPPRPARGKRPPRQEVNPHKVDYSSPTKSLLPGFVESKKKSTELPSSTETTTKKRIYRQTKKQLAASRKRRKQTPSG